MAPLLLVLALALGLILAWPQLGRTLRYLPRCVRRGQTAAAKQGQGSVPLRTFLRQLLSCRSRRQVDGVFHPEATNYVGLLALGLACASDSWHQWTLLVVSAVLTLGRHTPVFGWLAKGLLRTPARWNYFVGLALAFMATTGLDRLGLPDRWVAVLLLLQAWDLLMTTSRLIPMAPFTERWARPSRLLDTPITRYLRQHAEGRRVSGLPYPIQSGLFHRLHTLGYNGGFRLKSQARFWQDGTAMGTPAHDWFQIAPEDARLDWYGVGWAYTRRPLRPPAWAPTPIPHLYRRVPSPPHVPGWEEVADRYAAS